MYKNISRSAICLLILVLSLQLFGCGGGGGSAVLQTTSTSASPGQFVKAQKCQECHASIYNSWSSSYHGPAKNNEMGINVAHWSGGSLTSMLSCIYCKGTGISKTVYDSYCKDSSTSVALAATYTNLFSEPFVTSCEACHNAGSEHANSTSVGQFKSTIGNPGKMMKNNAVAVCAQCHSKGQQPVPSTLPGVKNSAVAAAFKVFDGSAIVSYAAGYTPFIINYVYGQLMPSDWVPPSYFIPFGTVSTKAVYAGTTEVTVAATPGDTWMKGVKLVNLGHAGGRQFANYSNSGPHSSASGPACFACHDPHSTNLKSESNDLCTKCHKSLETTTALTAHTKHGATSDGSKCWNCHMPKVSMPRVLDTANADNNKIVTPSHLYKIIRPDVSWTQGSASSADAGKTILTNNAKDFEGNSIANNKRTFLPNSCAGGGTGTCHIQATGSASNPKYGSYVVSSGSTTKSAIGICYTSSATMTPDEILSAAKAKFPNAATFK